MAVSRKTKKEEVKVEETANAVSDTEVVVDTNVESEPEVDTDITVEKTEDGRDIEIDTSVADASNAPKEKTVRVKLRKDISFNFAGERYDLVKGSCYNVPVAVKLHLNKQDVLSPL